MTYVSIGATDPFASLCAIMLLCLRTQFVNLTSLPPAIDRRGTQLVLTRFHPRGCTPSIKHCWWFLAGKTREKKKKFMHAARALHRKKPASINARMHRSDRAIPFFASFRALGTSPPFRPPHSVRLYYLMTSCEFIGTVAPALPG
jgi:hypothetical protein